MEGLEDQDGDDQPLGPGHDPDEVGGLGGHADQHRVKGVAADDDVAEGQADRGAGRADQGEREGGAQAGAGAAGREDGPGDEDGGQQGDGRLAAGRGAAGLLMTGRSA